MAFILPRGIFRNSDNINGSIESVAAQPLDPEDIAKFWKVYTTTTRRLLDPTAERLENYWWRIWGSRRRELSGATIARLFAHISDGQSFVPLRGPANRDEGTPPLNRTSRHGPGAFSSTAIHHPNQTRPSTTSSSTASKTPAPMPHPILKKTRGPSSTGPRPTARFISPHESDAESATTNSSNSSASPNSHVVVQPPSPDSQNSKLEKTTATVVSSKKKGRVVASSVAKKRTVITRRQSYQSSTDSAAKVEAQSSNQPSPEMAPPTLSEAPYVKRKAPSKFEDDFPPENQAALLPNKYPSSSSVEQKRAAPKDPSRKDSGIEGAQEIIVQEPGSSSGLNSFENPEVRSGEISEEELELQRSILQEANARTRKSSTASSKDILNDGDGSWGRRTSLVTSTDGAIDVDVSGVRLKGVPSLAPTLSDAMGQLDLGDASTSLSRVKGAEGRNKGKGKEPNAMFSKRSVSKAPGNAATPISEAPLSKSKSQLTLLLQKDRARKGEQRPIDGRKQDRKK